MDLKQNCTAGRTVLFSAVTVAMSLAGLLVFPLFFLRSLAYAGMAVALTAVAACPARSPGSTGSTCVGLCAAAASAPTTTSRAVPAPGTASQRP